MQSGSRSFRSWIISSTRWLWKRLPYPWALSFWLVWPWIVSIMTAKYWLKLTGEPMPKDRVKKLRKDLAEVTRGITKKE